MIALILLMTATAGLPSAYELDFGVLPPANTARSFQYTVVLSFEGEPDVPISFFFDKTHGPAEAADGLMDALGDARWKVKRDGVRVTIYGYDDVRIKKATVEGKKGPQPLVRRVPLAPPEKK